MSWDTVNIISVADVKTITGLNKNVEVKLLDVAIHDAQHDLKEALGETLYNRIEAADPVADTTLGGNTGLATLYSRHIKNYLAWCTVGHAYWEMTAGPNRNGVSVKSGDQYAPADGKVVSALQAKAASRAETRLGEMLRYIENLDATDQIYIDFNSCVDDEPRKTEVANTGRIITRISPWQNPYGTKRHRYGY